jgi:hypothetical protein
MTRIDQGVRSLGCVSKVHRKILHINRHPTLRCEDMFKDEDALYDWKVKTMMLDKKTSQDAIWTLG